MNEKKTGLTEKGLVDALKGAVTMHAPMPSMLRLRATEILLSALNDLGYSELVKEFRLASSLWIDE